MRPESRSALTHILEAAREIRLVSAGKTIAEYEADRHLRAIVGFRNVLVHGYDVVDEEQVWAAVTDELEYLIATAEGLLEEQAASPRSRVRAGRAPPKSGSRGHPRGRSASPARG